MLARGVVDLSPTELSRAVGSDDRMVLDHVGSPDAVISTAVDDILERGVLVDELAGLMNAEPDAEARVTAT